MSGYLRKTIIPGGALALLIAGLLFAFWPKPVPVSLASAERRPMLVTIEDEGETRVREVYTISSPLSGSVARFEGHVGDIVVAGKTMVASIRPTDPTLHDARTHSELEAAVKAAEAARDLAAAQVANAEATHDFAKAEYERGLKLADRGTLSRSALDRSRMEVRTKAAAVMEARAALRVRDFQLQRARMTLREPASARDVMTDEPCCVEVRAPVSGTILRVFRESEAVVQAGAPLVEIGDPTDLEIVVELLSTDAVSVSIEADVLIDGWGGRQSLKGQVRRIEPYGFTKVSALGIEEQRVKVIIDFVDPPALWQRLGHGYRVVARIVRWQQADALQAPLSALFRVRGAWSLFRVEDGRARLTRVEVGHTNGTSAEILSGLKAGDTLVLHPSDRIEDGIKVMARDAS
ncbi:MAG: HlyD family efflux transporter periplasmic adaptor subunit [Alphaproteobacteria bacterium]|nr:HlyD family efflux transporter periplasmic adaptor subunit [Alphaproteobacteria bacterium]